MKKIVIAGVASIALVFTSAAPAQAALYDQTAGPDITSTVPSKVSIAPGETTFTLSVSSAFEKRYDVSYPTYVPSIDGKKTDWSNLSVGEHTVIQEFKYSKYSAMSADCYVDSWYDGYDDVNGSWYTIKCNSTWGDVEAHQYFDWYENPYIMTLYGVVGHQFPVTSYPAGEHHDWYVFVPSDTKLSQGKAFTGSLVSHDDPQAKTLELTTAISVERKLTTAEPDISDTTPIVGQTLTATPGSWGPTGVTLTYQWMADGTAIPSATGKTLKLAAAQIAKSITVAVTGSLVGYATATMTSTSTAVVAALKLTATPSLDLSSGSVGSL